MVDPARLRALLDRIADELAHLRRLAGLDDTSLGGNPDRLAAVKYRLAIEAAIDAGEHIIASEGLRAPETFADVFRVLADAGWVTAEEATDLEAMARSRNLLVHAEVDDDRVVSILRERLDDLDHFRKAVAERAVAADDEGGPPQR
jgi:uncharacterized protein YutE (UPF0331/DUF86 family)